MPFFGLEVGEHIFWTLKIKKCIYKNMPNFDEKGNVRHIGGFFFLNGLLKNTDITGICIRKIIT